MSKPCASIDERIAGFTAAAEKDGFYTGQGGDAPPAADPGAAAVPGEPQPVPGEWAPNPQRIERLKGPAGRAWGFTWNTYTASKGVPELQVNDEQKENAGQAFAELLDACLPPEVISGPPSRGEVVVFSVLAIGGISLMNVKMINETIAEKENAKKAGGGGDGT